MNERVRQQQMQPISMPYFSPFAFLPFHEKRSMPDPTARTGTDDNTCRPGPELSIFHDWFSLRRINNSIKI